jgi:hypothetical protein
MVRRAVSVGEPRGTAQLAAAEAEGAASAVHNILSPSMRIRPICKVHDTRLPSQPARPGNAAVQLTWQQLRQRCSFRSAHACRQRLALTNRYRNTQQAPGTASSLQQPERQGGVQVGAP